METYINIGNFIELTENLGVLQYTIDKIADYYNKKSFNASDAYMIGNKNVDMIIRVSTNLDGLNYASRDYYESSEWKPAVSIISYGNWLHTRPSQDSPDSPDSPDLPDSPDSPDSPEQHNHYIYLLKDNLSFALMTMSGDVSDDYITLLDYSDISDVNVYTADFLLNSVLSAFNMDKFYQIPVKDSENPTINDVFDFLKKEK